ncbi:MAG: FIST N-terminal domain-containing protein [Calditrichia bacterium]|nr:FIST C-terminal domain-containing protein [Calditrichota bacterium]MCB0268764.1 FIST C-terminal domain-containing protein [Calditrichota bacterium]MCB0286466.1 FIST C-terminal domain-containing protein [Calditrichota bacterium]MCB9067350.1 FIST C-terminal domain-containing protein [Calditrichia bacterium]
MKCKSISTINIDPFEAGLEIGETLKSIAPEAIILLASVHYADFTELYEGIYSGLETEDVQIIGGTGDGFYETNRVENVGVCAMGFHSAGKVKWHMEIEKNLQNRSYDAGKACASRIRNAVGDDARLVFLFAGLSADGTKMVEGVRSELSIPCVGGLTGDDRSYQRGIVLANGKMYEDAIGMLCMSGDFPFKISLASGWQPIGEAAIVEDCEGNKINKISGVSTAEFITKQFGQPPSKADLGVITLAAYMDKESNEFVQRSPFKMDADTGAITYFGSVDEGTPVKVCYATRDNVIKGVNEAIDKMSSLEFNPTCAVVISCAGRKWILGDRTHEEVEKLSAFLPKDLPLVGFPSYGEIAPLQKDDGTYSGSYFHNVTYVVTLFG